MVKQNWCEIKKHLKSYSKEELSGVVQEMYKLGKVNKEFLHLKFLAGNSPQQKKLLLENTISAIHKGWDKAEHDPFGNYGPPQRIKITPIKSPLTNYKKALGDDEGYVLVLSAYVTSGLSFLDKNWESPTVAESSIDSALSELFKLILKKPEYIQVLPIETIKTLSSCMDGDYNLCSIY